MPGLKAYAISLAVGVLVGALYSILNVRSPAPPVVALVGLLGILLGEQVVPIAKQMIAPTPAKLSTLGADCAAHLFGGLPGQGLGGTAHPTTSSPQTSPERSA
jgi:XapX domain-containing protein